MKYPEWIDEYAKSLHNAFKNMFPASWGPVDVFAVVGALNGTFIDKVHEAIQNVNNEPVDKLAKCFSCPSTIRVALLFLVTEYHHCKNKDKEKFKEVAEFLLKILNHIMKKDVFSYSSNIVHGKEEINELVNGVPWKAGNPRDARELGKLYNSCAALSCSLYRDFYPQESNEIYGPYELSSDTILLIKHFPKINPVELWPKFNLKYKDIKIYQIYKDLKFKCEIIGMHSIYEGNTINGLVKYAVEVDGKFVDIEEVKRLAEEIAEIATKQAVIYENMNQEELVKKVLEWNCYQFYQLFKLANMSWKPTKEMLEAVKGKKFPERAEFPTFPEFKEYTTSKDFDVYWLKDLYN